MAEYFDVSEENDRQGDPEVEEGGEELESGVQMELRLALVVPCDQFVTPSDEMVVAIDGQDPRGRQQPNHRYHYIRPPLRPLFQVRQRGSDRQVSEKTTSLSSL